MTRFAWHIHHDRLVEPLLEPIKRRREYIRDFKPKGERPLRLRLFKTVKGKLPQAVEDAGQAYRKVFRAWWSYGTEARALDMAAQTYSVTVATHHAEIEALHRAECPDCPWDGKTIFKRGAD